MEIELTRGQVAVVDAEDADLAGWAWYAKFARGRYTGAVRNSDYVRGQPRCTTHMHRVIMTRALGRELQKCEFVDHIDGDVFNNTRANLRLATKAENGRNRTFGRNNTSGLCGVGWHKAAGKWRARITANGKVHNLGHFDTPEEAGLAYDEAARRLHGEFARTNS